MDAIEFEIPMDVDDLWLLIITSLSSGDFIAVRQTCNRFYQLTDHNYKKHTIANKYWKKECQRLCFDVKKAIDNKFIAENNKWFDFYRDLTQFLIANKYVNNFNECSNISKPITLYKMSKRQRKQHKRQHRQNQVYSYIYGPNYNRNIENFNQNENNKNVNDNNNNNKNKLKLMQHPILLACKQDRLSIFQMLEFRFNVKNINQRFYDLDDCCNHSALFTACCNGSIKIARYLLGFSLINSKLSNANLMNNKNNNNNSDNSDNNHDHNTNSTSRNIDNININRVKNIDLNMIEGEDDDTLLTKACSNGHIEIVSLLLKHPKMTTELINKGDFCDYRPIQCTDNKDIISLLLNDKRTDINATSEHSFRTTPLMHFVGNVCETNEDNSSTCAMMLIDRNDVDINARDNNGHSALDIAIHYGRINIVSKMLKHPKININSMNLDGETPLMIAQRNKRDEIMKMIENISIQLC